MNIPKYVQEILEQERLEPAPVNEQDANLYGYTYRLYRPSNVVFDSTLSTEAERLCAWACREYAEANVVRHVRFTEKEHRKPYYKRDYVIVNITDPVALELEKNMERKGA